MKDEVILVNEVNHIFVGVEANIVNSIVILEDKMKIDDALVLMNNETDMNREGKEDLLVETSLA